MNVGKFAKVDDLSLIVAKVVEKEMSLWMIFSSCTIYFGKFILTNLKILFLFKKNVAKIIIK